MNILCIRRKIAVVNPPIASASAIGAAVVAGSPITISPIAKSTGAALRHLRI